jgi:hypothetical protein
MLFGGLFQVLELLIVLSELMLHDHIITHNLIFYYNMTSTLLDGTMDRQTNIL